MLKVGHPSLNPSRFSITASFRLASVTAIGVAMMLPSCAFIADEANRRIDNELEQAEFEEAIIPQEAIVARPQAPLIIPLAITDSSTVFELPRDISMANWGYIIATGNATRSPSSVEIFEIDSSELVYVSETPIQFRVQVLSRDGKRSFSSLLAESEVVPLSSCDFVLPAAAEGDAETVQLFGASLSKCFSEWVMVNGIPQDLAFNISSSPIHARSEVESGDEGPSAQGFSLQGDLQVLARRNAQAKQFRVNVLNEEASESLNAVFDNRDIIDLKDISMTFSIGWELGASVLQESPECTNYAGEIRIRGFGYLPGRTPEDPSASIIFHSAVVEGNMSTYELRIDYEGEPAYEVRTGLVPIAAETVPSDKTDFLMHVLDTLDDYAQANKLSGTEGLSIPFEGGYVIEGPCPRSGSINATFSATPTYDPNDIN